MSTFNGVNNYIYNINYNITPLTNARPLIYQCRRQTTPMQFELLKAMALALGAHGRPWRRNIVSLQRNKVDRAEKRLSCHVASVNAISV